jgi:hypothetical protein
MFDIAFIPDAPPYVDDEDGWHGRWGRTVLGDYQERFVAPVEGWRPADYERQWILAARRLIAGHASSAFSIEAGRLWWTAWRVGDDVVFQQRLLVAEEMRPAWSASADAIPYELVGERRSLSDEGDQVSEWRVPLDDIREFLTRRAGDVVTRA